MAESLVRDRASVAAVGLAGVLLRPAGAVPNAGVIVIGGSEGGYHERDAAAFAAHGYASLALAYFGADGVPPVLKEIPLEYFFRAVDLLTGLGAARVGLVGGSRGGEASLLIASCDQRVDAVVSVVGSGVVTPGIDYSLGRLDRILGAGTVAWTLAGDPLPALPHRIAPQLARAIESYGTIALRDAFAPLPDDRTELARISIPIERSRAAVLLIAGGDDRMWDAPAYHAVAAERLAAAGHPFPVEHVVLPGAGHQLAGPPGAPIRTITTPGPGATFQTGGDPVTTTAAREQAWRRTLEFLDLHLS